MNRSTSQKIFENIGTGHENAVTSYSLRQLTGSTERELRKAIEQLRRSGHVIVSCDNGYYKPETLEEVQQHIKKESRRARSIFYTLRSARRLESAMLSALQENGGGENG